MGFAVNLGFEGINELPEMVWRTNVHAFPPKKRVLRFIVGVEGERTVQRDENPL